MRSGDLRAVPGGCRSKTGRRQIPAQPEDLQSLRKVRLGEGKITVLPYALSRALSQTNCRKKCHKICCTDNLQ